MGRSAQAEIPEVVVTHSDGLELRQVATVLLDKNVPGSGLMDVGEDALPIDTSPAHGSKGVGAGCPRILLRTDLDALAQVFDMQHWKPPGIEPPVVERISPGIGDPEDIHFHLQEVRVAVLQHDVVAGGSAHLGEFVEMGVVTELNSGLL